MIVALVKERTVATARPTTGRATTRIATQIAKKIAPRVAQGQATATMRPMALARRRSATPRPNAAKERLSEPRSTTQLASHRLVAAQNATQLATGRHLVAQAADQIAAEQGAAETDARELPNASAQAAEAVEDAGDPLHRERTL